MNIRPHIGVHADGFVDWGGGVDFIRVILGALANKERAGQIELTLLLPDTAPSWGERLRSGLTALREYNLLQHLREQHWKAVQAKSERASVLDTLSQVGQTFRIETYQGHDGLLRSIRRSRIDALIPCISYMSRDFPVPWVGYLFDYQHKYLPDQFSEAERDKRDASFARMLASATAVVVHSEAAKHDIETFNPDHVSKIFSLPIAPLPNADWFADDRVGVVSKYGLPERFFLISNQFWRHKSHMTAFEALALLRRKDEFKDVAIICTGLARDTRHPGYFPEVQRGIAELGLGDAVKIVGYIPKLDQIQLMKRAIALIQPTLFEGSPGGLSVYDALALGVRAIVSDIPVNLEIQEPNVTFFQAAIAEDLTEKMCQSLNQSAPRIDKALQLNLAKRRTDLLGDRLLEAVTYAGERHVYQASKIQP